MFWKVITPILVTAFVVAMTLFMAIVEGATASGSRELGPRDP